MAKVYTFRVLIDYEKDVFRDIQMLETNTFTDFHNLIQEAFKFDGSQMASFYLSNENWDKGEEIAMEHIIDNDPAPLMHNTSITDKVSETGEKLVYVFDFLLMWCFFVEVVKIETVSDIDKFPAISHYYGEAPDQYSKEVSIDDNLFDLDEDDAELGGDNDIFEGFDDFDQQEYDY